jgi:predicted transposase YbfD/YdcC
LALKGAIVTIDAMGCQRSICQQVIDQESDYVIGLKGNQGSLREDVAIFFDEHLERNIGGQFVTSAEIIEADHGRIETRRCTVCSDTQWLINRHNWPGLNAVIMTEYTREIRKKIETVRRFYISSFVDSPENMAQHIRNHWQVENCLHWVLVWGDTSF